MAAPELLPGQRHLYNISLKLNVTENRNRIYLSSSHPMCLTCSMSNMKLQPIKNIPSVVEAHTLAPLPVELLMNDNGEKNATFLLDLLPELLEHDNEDANRIANSCLYNKVHFSANFTYYVQECLGPEAPTIYLVETATNTKISLLDGGDELRNRLKNLAVPQIRTFGVEIRHGFMAQVRLLLPPGMKEDEEIAFPLVLDM